MAPEEIAALKAARNVIYLITNTITGKQYVGQTRQTAWKRWREHRAAALGEPHQSYGCATMIAGAMRQFGVDAVRIEILEVCDPCDLDNRERHWIAALGTLHPKGYNARDGGDSPQRGTEFGAKISAANKGRIKGPEWRAKLSASHKGKVISAEQRAKNSAFHTGRRHSEETRLKRSLALKGRIIGPYSEARRAAIAAGTKLAMASLPPDKRKRLLAGSTSRRGKTNTPEHNAKIAASHIGIRHTEETKRKISLLQKGKKRGPYSAAHIEAARAGLRRWLDRRAEENRQLRLDIDKADTE